MKADVCLVREPSDWSVPRELLVLEERPSHRPVSRFRRIRLSTSSDVERARRCNLAVSLLDPDQVTELGFPMRFRPRLIVARDIRPAIDSAYPVIEFASSDAARTPHIEDVVVAMLRVDTLAARALALRNRGRIDPERLLKRVLQEDLEVLATLVRLQDIAPAIPLVGRALPREQLRRQDRKNPPHETRP